MNIVENSLICCGIDDGNRNVSITLGSNTRKTGDVFQGNTFKKIDEAFGGVPPFKPFVKKLHGLKDVVKRFPFFTLAREWCGFLKGEPLVLPNNELVIRSWGEIVPDRAMGEYVMNAFLRCDSAYLKFGKLDDCLDVKAEVVEGSPRLSYFRKQKIDPNGKVMMRCTFALKIQLKSPIASADISSLKTTPWKQISQDPIFYPKIKAVLENYENYYYSKFGNYIIKKAECEGESNCRFSLEQAYNGSSNFFKFLSCWLFANQEKDDAKLLTAHCYNSFQGHFVWTSCTDPGRRQFQSAIQISHDEQAPRVLDFVHCLEFMEKLTFAKIRELAWDEGHGSSVYRRFYGVTVFFRVHSGITFENEFNEARDAAVDALKKLIEIFKDAETFMKDQLEAEWQDFSEGHKIYMADGSEIPPLDKYGSMLVAQTICLDPQLYMDQKHAFYRFASHVMTGDFYNG